MSEDRLIRGHSVISHRYADIALYDLDRATVERLLANWFTWLGDRAAVTVAPAGERQAAELRVRRWKTRPDLVLFRWRNSDATRQSFGRVRARFEADRQALDIELTPKTKKPRAMVIPLDAADVFTPAGVVGLANRAFEAAGFPDCQRYDLTCSGTVLEGAVRRRPLREAYETVRALGLLAILAPRRVWHAIKRRRGRD